MSTHNQRLRMMLWPAICLAAVWLAVGNRVIPSSIYAVDQNRVADLNELQNVGDLATVNAVSRAFRMVARLAQPSVVHIRVSGGTDFTERIGEELGLNEEQIDELRRFHRRPEMGSGSGVIFDEAGYILTNSHVVEPDAFILVRLWDDREFEAELVGIDAKSDLAVIKIDAPRLQPLPFGNSDNLEVGDWVIAVGAPFGLTQSVTHGIVSAKGRSDIADMDIQYQDFIQTDASINPGNSGGPLLNLRGEIVGVNTAIATHGDGYNAGIAFSIPSNMAERVAGELKSSGKVTRGWLGISMLPLTADDVHIFGLQNSDGVLVEQVLPGTPAEAGGFQVEDIVVRINGQRVRNSQEVRHLIADMRPGDRVSFEVIRDEELRQINVRIGRQPEDIGAVSVPGWIRQPRELSMLDMLVRALRPGMTDVYSNFDRGVLVIESESVSEIAVGELVVACNGERVKSVHELRSALREAASGLARLQVIDPNGERRTELIDLRGRR